MLKLALNFLLLIYTFTTFSQDNFFNVANNFLSKYVDANGQVAYAKIENAEIEKISQLIANFSLDKANAETEKSFLINCYNLLIIKQVKQLMPLKSPLDNSKFFNGIKHTVAGKQLTLDELEKGMLMKKYPDARLHFVLVCAAKSCPPLANFAYQPSNLEKQLEDRTQWVLNLNWFVRDENKILVSKIFEWYANDFGGKKSEFIVYINKYRKSKLSTSKSIDYYEYDWSLNNQN